MSPRSIQTESPVRPARPWQALLLTFTLLVTAGCASSEATPEDSAKPSPGPALWTLSDDDSTIVLFGTVHLLRPDTEWRTPLFETLWADADSVHMEADTESEATQQALAASMQQLGMFQDGRTLGALLNEAQTAKVQEATQALGVPFEALMPLKPWLAGLQLSVMQLVRSGYDPASGVETVLGRDPAIADKERGYFETAIQQLEYFEKLSGEDQVALLVAGAEAIVDKPDSLDQLVDAWVIGDVETLGTLMADVSAFGSQAVYNLLLTERNRAWIPQIESLLEREGTHVVAVGAGHLAGADSVIAMLRDRGHTVTRR